MTETEKVDVLKDSKELKRLHEATRALRAASFAYHAACTRSYRAEQEAKQVLAAAAVELVEAEGAFEALNRSLDVPK